MINNLTCRSSPPPATTQPPVPPIFVGDAGISPTAAAKAIVSILVLSLPESVKSFLLTISTKHNRLKSREKQQLNTTACFAEEDFIPRSTRFKFELRGSDDAKELENFPLLQTEVTTALTLCEKTLKTTMQSAIQLELQLVRKTMTTAFCKAVFEIASVFYLLRHPKTTREAIPAHALSRFVINKLTTNFFEHLPINPTNVQASYSEYAQDDVVFDPTADTPANQLTPFTAVLNAILPLLTGIYKDSWTAQLENLAAKAQLVAPEKLLRDFAVGAATEAASMEIDTNPTVDPQLLKDLIATEVASQTKKLKKELEKFQQQERRSKDTTAKNPPRGDALPRASSTKKRKQAKKNQKPTPRKSVKGQADDAAKGSSKQVGRKKGTPKNKNNRGTRTKS